VQEMQEISAFNFLYHHANQSQQNCRRTTDFINTCAENVLGEFFCY